MYAFYLYKCVPCGVHCILLCISLSSMTCNHGASPSPPVHPYINASAEAKSSPYSAPPFPSKTPEQQSHEWRKTRPAWMNETKQQSTSLFTEQDLQLHCPALPPRLSSSSSSPPPLIFNLLSAFYAHAGKATLSSQTHSYASVMLVPYWWISPRDGLNT